MVGLRSEIGMGLVLVVRVVITNRTDDRGDRVRCEVRV